MKINELLNESSNQYSDEKLFEIILNSKFYNDNKHILDYDFALFRGIDGEVDTNTIHNFKFRSKPTDSSILIHDIVNELSEEQLGLEIRNLMFGTTDATVADGYGTVRNVFPIGNYELYYHPDVGDFLTVIANEDRLYSVIIEGNDDNFSHSMQDEFELLIDNVNDNDQQTLSSWFKDTNIDHIKTYISEIVGFTIDLNREQLHEKALKMAERYIQDSLLPTYNFDDEREVAKIIRHLFKFGIDLIIEFLEDNMRGYIDEINEANDLSDTTMGGDGHEIMIYCEQFILLSTEQYDEFLNNYHNAN
ncbi:hypothetical protein PBI_SCTP2_399 [Salicola phage SCTP-2]|nr:hypothetical protein PBI_SCTP2_399 [Salicola phage SCTP-2]